MDGPCAGGGSSGRHTLMFFGTLVAVAGDNELRLSGAGVFSGVYNPVCSVADVSLCSHEGADDSIEVADNRSDVAGVCIGIESLCIARAEDSSVWAFNIR